MKIKKNKKLKTRQIYFCVLLHKNWKSKQEKLRKTLAHKKLGVVVIPKNRAIAGKKRQRIRIVKNNKTLAHKVKLLSRLWLKNRVAFRKNEKTLVAFRHQSGFSLTGGKSVLEGKAQVKETEEKTQVQEQVSST